MALFIAGVIVGLFILGLLWLLYMVAAKLEDADKLNNKGDKDES